MCVSRPIYHVNRLDRDYTVKVTDGALAQHLYPECYYTLFGATRPVRWAAVETLQEGLCTSRSNIVSSFYVSIYMRMYCDIQACMLSNPGYNSAEFTY